MCSYRMTLYTSAYHALPRQNELSQMVPFHVTAIHCHYGMYFDDNSFEHWFVPNSKLQLATEDQNHTSELNCHEESTQDKDNLPIANGVANV